MEALSDVTVHNAREGIKGSQKRHMQCPQGATNTANYNDYIDEKAGSFGVGRVATAVHNEHFKRLLEAACPDHVYPVKHKLKFCIMMKSFMILAFLTRGMEPDEDPSGSDTMPFLREDAFMMFYDGRPMPVRRRMSKLSPRLLTHYGWGHGNTGV
jgi:hypothetical protein